MKDEFEKFNLKGVFAAVSTPLHPNLKANDEELALHCQDLLQRGCSGVVIFGTTGEGSSFSLSERKEILKNLIDRGFPPGKLLIGASFCAIEDVVAFIQEGLRVGSPAFLVMPPFFFKNVTDEGVIAFYDEVIQRVSNRKLKMILYHIPQFSGVPITLKVIKTLTQKYRDTVIGIKESEGNFSLTKEILIQFPNFKVFVGNETHLAESVSLGASGGISGLANVFPELLCSLYNQREVNINLRAIEEIKHIIKEYPIFSAIKVLIAFRRGSQWLLTRPPLLPLDEVQKQSLMEKMRKFFC